MFGEAEKWISTPAADLPVPPPGEVVRAGPEEFPDRAATRSRAFDLVSEFSKERISMTDPEFIFARYYAKEEFVDRYASRPEGAVDVIIPVLASNELWEKNLISIYREIPVNRLLLGDGGCADDTIAIARKFPRLQVLDHTSYKTSRLQHQRN